MTDPDWLARFPARAETVGCAGARHRISWRAGVLTLEDHPDVDAERALAAFGAQAPICVEVAKVWHARLGNVDALEIASSIGTPSEPDLEKLRESLRRNGSSGWVVTVGSRREGESVADASARARAELPNMWWKSLLRNLPGYLRSAFVATSVARLEERGIGDDGSALDPVVQQTAAWAVGGAVVGARGPHSEARIPAFDVRLATDGRWHLRVEPDGPTVRARVPLRWLGDLWARGLRSAGGYLFLEVLEADPDSWETIARAVRWRWRDGVPDGQQGIVRASLDERGRWETEWLGSPERPVS